MSGSRRYKGSFQPRPAHRHTRAIRAQIANDNHILFKEVPSVHYGIYTIIDTDSLSRYSFLFRARYIPIHFHKSHILAQLPPSAVRKEEDVHRMGRNHPSYWEFQRSQPPARAEGFSRVLHRAMKSTQINRDVLVESAIRSPWSPNNFCSGSTRRA